MQEKDWFKYLKSSGLADNFVSIVDEPNFSKEQLRNFEVKFRLSTKDFLALKKEDLIANYGLDREAIIDWKIAEDNFNFYSLENNNKK